MSRTTPGSLDGSARERLELKAKWVWRETLKIHRRAPETRIASSLSAVELLTVLYYGGFLRLDAARPLWELRDRFIVSKGHGAIALYPILADLGFFPAAEFERVCRSGGILGGIPDPVIPGFETVNGSLGHGLGVGAGMALGLRRKGSASRVYVVVGDGELHEGANWEALMFAAQQRLGNLTIIVDDNGISMLDHTERFLSHRSLCTKLAAFGWRCEEVNGHSVAELHAALATMTADDGDTPGCILAHTRKGRGVPGLEDVSLSHVMAIPRDVIDRLLGDSS